MYHRLYIEYLYYFNIERDYYECHEVMEEYWMGEGKNRLLQALLQIAVGLHHFRNGNRQGAVKLLEQAMDKQHDTWDGELGINKERLFTEASRYLTHLRHFDADPFKFYDLTIEIVDPHLQKLVLQCSPQGVADEDKF